MCHRYSSRCCCCFRRILMWKLLKSWDDNLCITGRKPIECRRRIEGVVKFCSVEYLTFHDAVSISSNLTYNILISTCRNIVIYHHLFAKVPSLVDSIDAATKISVGQSRVIGPQTLSLGSEILTGTRQCRKRDCNSC